MGAKALMLKKKLCSFVAQLVFSSFFEDGQLGSARGIFEPARVLDILQERAISALQNFHCWKILIT